MDLIFTDPPYALKDISVYKDLAIVAFRVLKDGGSLVTNVNHCLIPDLLDYMSDFIESKSAEKTTFEWEQSPIEAEHVISRLTVEGQLVCDPMMGEGTSSIAAS